MEREPILQKSLWADPSSGQESQHSPTEKQQSAARRVQRPLPMATPVTLWEQEPGGTDQQSLAELQEFVRNFVYQPLPTPEQTTALAHTASRETYRPDYEIFRSNPTSNIWSAQSQRAEAIVSVSGGAGFGSCG